ncbi:hypothetical protein VTI74DRAFT_2671 [Chaetomium olivicolor]
MHIFPLPATPTSSTRKTPAQQLCTKSSSVVFSCLFSSLDVALQPTSESRDSIATFSPLLHVVSFPRILGTAAGDDWRCLGKGIRKPPPLINTQLARARTQRAQSMHPAAAQLDAENFRPHFPKSITPLDPA